MTRGLAVAAVFEMVALADLHRHADDGIVARLAVDFGEHDVGLMRGEETGALHRRQLEGIADDKHLGAEAQEIAAEGFVHHRDFVDDDEVGGGRFAFGIEDEAGLVVLVGDQRIDQRVDG